MARWREEIARRLEAAQLDPAREAEIVRELDQHLGDRYREMRALGRSEQDAQAAALAELDDDIGLREELQRTLRKPEAMPPGMPGAWAGANWAQDIRYALRMLRRTPAFTAVAILTLALGMGATVAIFSVVYTVLFRPLPLPNADRLVVPISVNRERNTLRGSVPYADYADWREERDVFDGVALFSQAQIDIAGDPAPERIDAASVSPEYFTLVRAQPLVGRLLAPPDHAPGAPRVVVLSDRLWKRRFGGDPGIAGRQIRISGAVATVAGVVAADRLWPAESDIWMPLRAFLLPEDTRVRRDNMIFQSLARLRDGVPLAQARARVAAMAERVAADPAAGRKGWTTDLVPLRDFIVEPEIRLGMFVLLAAVGFVLLIAAVNLANLLLARGADRLREMALRAALGASRRRLVRQLMTESLLLAAAGAAAGLMLAYWLLQALKGAAPAGVPMVEQTRLDAVALVVSVALAVVTAIVFGLLPALATSAFQPVDALRDGGRTSSPGRRAARLRDTLVVAQMAIAIVLLVGAGLMLRSFGHLLRLDPGVDIDRILAGRVVVPSARYPEPDQRAQFYERLIDGLRAAPGVEGAAATSYLPAGARGFGLGRVFLLEGQAEPPASQDHDAMWNVVTPDYFRTVGIPVIRGRAFTVHDLADSKPVMIINQTMAARVFGSADPLGRRMRSWRDENLLREVVGVVGDVRYGGLADEDRSLVYVPHRQNAWPSMTVAIRVHGAPVLYAETLRREVARLDKDIAVARVEPLTESAARSIAPQRFGALLLALFAAAAALLAGVGVYGVMSYAVSRRRHELGVRLALGAGPRNLFGLVVRRGLLLAGMGAVLGLGGAVATAPILRGLLSGVSPLDPPTLLMVPVLLTGVAFLACAIPGRRAARVHPIEALKE